MNHENLLMHKVPFFKKPLNIYAVTPVERCCSVHLTQRTWESLRGNSPSGCSHDQMSAAPLTPLEATYRRVA